MLWSAVLFGVLGALIGLQYRAPALIPATVVAVAWAGGAGWMAQHGVAGVAATAAVLAVVLHAAYLVALALRTIGRRSLR